MTELLQSSQKVDKRKKFKHIVLLTNRETLYQRINERCKNMINSGMIEETKRVLDMGYSTDCYGLTGVGYRHIIKYFKNEISKNDLIEKSAQDTRQYVKRQITWFSKQKDITILNIDNNTSFK